MGEARVVVIPANPRHLEMERRLQVVVRAEGPTRVLSIANLQVCTHAAAWHPTLHVAGPLCYA